MSDSRWKVSECVVLSHSQLNAQLLLHSLCYLLSLQLFYSHFQTFPLKFSSSWVHLWPACLYQVRGVWQARHIFYHSLSQRQYLICHRSILGLVDHLGISNSSMKDSLSTKEQFRSTTCWWTSHQHRWFSLLDSVDPKGRISSSHKSFELYFCLLQSYLNRTSAFYLYWKSCLKVRWCRLG